MKEIAEIEIEECIALTIDKYKVVVCVDNRDIGRIVYSINPYHAENCYLELQLLQYDVQISKCIFDKISQRFKKINANFDNIEDELVLVCLDEEKIESEVRYEDGDNCGRAYPHVYGLINNSAVIMVLPFLRDENGKYVKNIEFARFEDR